MSAVQTTSDLDKLTCEIFSILENKFLFGGCLDNTLLPKSNHRGGKVRILSIDGGHPILAAKSLLHLESVVRRESGDPDARIADYFDVAAGSGAGGVLAALLFTRRKDAAAAAPLFTAGDALKFLLAWNSLQGRLFRSREKAEKKLLKKVFGDGYTLRDTLKSVLIPCYDLSTDAPFVFSRSDAVESDGYDFRMRDVCAATAVARKPFEMSSVNGRTRIVAVDGRMAMSNPTAAAITHVLNNKIEFPFCNGVEDLLVLSLGNGGMAFRTPNGVGTPSFSSIAEDGAADMVDQAVAMAFGQSRSNSYVRIQANNVMTPGRKSTRGSKSNRTGGPLEAAEDKLGQEYVESVLFRGKKVGDGTNLDRLEKLGEEIVKESERRKTSILPPVVLKQMITVPATPRTSSSTSLTSMSSST
ncbi:hypothetical protein MLD38_039245 [Melastoma candidum]|uniref:Uncharacterized protein n=1 Tax=Melastoma candidum TaxID=119954 RepID=A0ACB9L1H5_9MYRT|nr:hypothetical protein MLD38_039245 [Melastoma candidum]